MKIKIQLLIQKRTQNRKMVNKYLEWDFESEYKEALAYL